MKNARLQQVTSVGAVPKAMQSYLGPDSFRSLNLSNQAQESTGRTSVFVVTPEVVAGCPSTVGVDWLSDRNKAKFTYSSGQGPGSLVDLVVQVHGTTFPRNTSELWQPEALPGRRGPKSRP